jgi:phosphoglycolate phosphatase
LAETASAFQVECVVTDLAALNRATIAFDLDGTLVDSAPDLIAALNAILIAEGFEPLSYHQGVPLIGHGALRLRQRGPAAAGSQNPAARADALFDQ